MWSKNTVNASIKPPGAHFDKSILRSGDVIEGVLFGGEGVFLGVMGGRSTCEIVNLILNNKKPPDKREVG